MGFFLIYVFFGVGEGRCFHFWNDVCWDKPLKHAFSAAPDLVKNCVWIHFADWLFAQSTVETGGEKFFFFFGCVRGACQNKTNIIVQ